jgi:formamidopyrimidine-DNA glycosylase
MPELSDVEGFRRYLARYAKGRRIDAVEVLDGSMLRNSSAQALGRAVRGRRFAAPERHGKWLIAPVGEAELLLHFGMTGLLRWTSGENEHHRHDRIVFHCPGGQLRYRNMRKFGGLWLARSEAERARVMGRLGPDAMAVGAVEFDELISRRRGKVKAALMDQKLIAGLGNLLADEILWRARINPRRPMTRLSRKDRRTLYETMGDVLRESNRRARVPSERGWLTGVRDKRGAACRRCGTELRKATIAGRTACWCPSCQRR